MRYFSIVAFATGEADLIDHQVYLDQGMNVFSVYTENIDAVVDQLVEQGVQVQSVHALDTFESVPPPPPLDEDTEAITPGES